MRTEIFEKLTIKQIAAYWFSNVALFSALYYGLSLIGSAVSYQATFLTEIGNAIYFSFNTALTIGSGNIFPVSFGKVLAVIESLISITLIGLFIGKIVAKKQEKLIEEVTLLSIEEASHNIISELYLFRNQAEKLLQQITETEKKKGAQNKKFSKNLSKEVALIQSELTNTLRRFNELIEKEKITINDPQRSMMHLSLMTNSINYSLSRLVELIEEFDKRKIDRNKESTAAALTESVKIKEILYDYSKKVVYDEQIKVNVEEKLEDLDKVIAVLQKSA
ncbi:MAG: hypothetical protein KatS3mg002_0637 [Candidatus Woesearchaeota archaeon]|nr:MAG: hypothetical protein KatS3mg002_0637 [Candidatus Woesearchaeota archaeon]